MEKSILVSAPINIALIKYWGKKDEDLIIPMNNSISLTLDQRNLKSTTFLRASTNIEENVITFNNKKGVISSRMKSVFDYAISKSTLEIDIKKNIKFEIKTENNFPTAAGLASSASGMAALAFALGGVFNLSEIDVSIMARLGSGSATRSVFGGIVEWRGDNAESRSVQLFSEDYWPQLRILICVVNKDEKKVPSTAAMQTSKITSQLLTHRYEYTVKENIRRILKAFNDRDFSEIGLVTMRESNQLHAICLDTIPPIVYLNSVSFMIIDFVHAFNNVLGSVRLAYTFDAGPNAFLLYEKDDEAIIKYCLNYSFDIFLEDHVDDRLINEQTLEMLHKSLPRLKGSIESIIETSIGPGPQECQMEI